MCKRPELNRQLDGQTFKSFYYLKEELIKFCRDQGLPVSGGKLDLTDRIAHYLDTGQVIAVKPTSKKATSVGEITLNTKIEKNFVCSENHRAFFKKNIGNGFSFNVAFQKWLKENTGKTYAQAIEAYYQIREEKKAGKSTIDKQFEYNTYIRDFFADNSDSSLEDAIKCWKYKKSLQGHNRYERSDLAALYQCRQ